jgi:hypothetical protein
LLLGWIDSRRYVFYTPTYDGGYPVVGGQL